MGALVSTSGGQEVPVQMGSYGIGVSRLVGAIIEASHDANGIVWPEPVAPFQVGLVNIRTGDATCERACGDIFTPLRDAGVALLYDDRPQRAGLHSAQLEENGKATGGAEGG